MYNNLRHILASETKEQKILFSKENINFVSKIITADTGCTVKDEQIVKILDSFYSNGTRDLQVLTVMTAKYISNYIINDLSNQNKNKNLNIWTTQYVTSATPLDELRIGSDRLSRTDTIKIREKNKNSGLMIETY